MKLDQGTKKNACIVGVGRSIISRDSGKTAANLMSDAIVAAVKDAGLTKKDIDGLATHGMAGANGYDLNEHLRFPEINWYGQMELPQVTAMWGVLEAAMAVEYGACKYAVAVMGLMKPKGTGSKGSRRDPFAGVVGAPRISGNQQFMTPFGAGGFIFVFWMARHMWQFGTPRETFGHIAVTQRKHAVMNPRAIARTPLTMEDYMSARMIASPMCLYDCDYPVDGYAAVVITTPERARHLPNKPVQIICGSQNTGPRTDTLQWDDMAYDGAKFCSQKMWSLAGGLTVKDMDLACLYDGFTILTVNWIENLGFCKLGEAKDFLKGDRMQLGGTGPTLNPHGGMCSEGRVHGMGFIAEAADQLMGRCGPRQVPNAKRAVVANGAGVQCACMVLQTLD
ncbi:MAG: thiolase family protein [Chloroflexi bacterium]|nr:thiolase family protein [Chloroflexota bacterium]